MTQKDNIQNYICTSVFIFTIFTGFFFLTLIVAGVAVLSSPIGIFGVFPVLLTVLTVGGLWLWLMDWLLDNLPYVDDPNRFDPSREYGDE